MIRSKKIIYIILYLLIYMGAVQKYILNSQLLSFLPDILVYITSINALVKKRHVKKMRYLVGVPLCTVYFLLIISSIFGAIFNSLNLVSYLWGLKTLISYPLLFWCIYLCFSEQDVQRYKKIMQIGFWVNILFCFIQFFSGERGDAMTGTFTANGPLMLFCLLVFLITSADYFKNKIKLRKLLYVVASLMLIAIWAEIKMMYFLFPLTFYAMYVFVKKFNVKLVILLIAGFFLLVPTMQFFMSFYYGDDYVQQTFDSEFIEKETSNAYGFQDGGFNRSTAIEKTDEVLLNTPMKQIFGNGLGCGSISSFFSTGFSSIYRYTSFWNFSTSYCLTEMGWLGMLLYGFFFFFIILRFYSQYRKSKDAVIRYWCSIGIVSGLVTYLLAWYDDNVYIKYLPMYFFWAVCIVSVECRKKGLLKIKKNSYDS